MSVITQQKQHNYTLKTQAGRFEVAISPSTSYGFFEHDQLGDECGGGLWFEGKALTDYDGVYSLPKSVIKGIRELGYTVPRDFENYRQI